jgi:hypothetical protein
MSARMVLNLKNSRRHGLTLPGPSTRGDVGHEMHAIIPANPFEDDVHLMGSQNQDGIASWGSLHERRNYLNQIQPLINCYFKASAWDSKAEQPRSIS